MKLFVVAFVAFLAATAVSADWWDDLSESVSSKIHTAANWVTDTGAPAVREKFNQVKETLQDPETHKAAKEWISDKADKVSDFAQTEVLPELKKVYEAAVNGFESSSENPPKKD